MTWHGRAHPLLPSESLCSLGPSLQPCRVFSAVASHRKRENVLDEADNPSYLAAGGQRTLTRPLIGSVPAQLPQK